MQFGEKLLQSYIAEQMGNVMYKFCTLTINKVTALKKRRVNVAVLYPYMDYLETLQVGDYGEVTVEDGESKQTIKRRTTVAAKQLEMAIKWQRSQDENTLLFEMVPVADEGLIDRAGKIPEQESKEESGPDRERSRSKKQH